MGKKNIAQTGIAPPQNPESTRNDKFTPAPKMVAAPKGGGVKLGLTVPKVARPAAKEAPKRVPAPKIVGSPAPKKGDNSSAMPLTAVPQKESLAGVMAPRIALEEPEKEKPPRSKERPPKSKSSKGRHNSSSKNNSKGKSKGKGKQDHLPRGKTAQQGFYCELTQIWTESPDRMRQHIQSEYYMKSLEKHPSWDASTLTAHLDSAEQYFRELSDKVKASANPAQSAAESKLAEPSEVASENYRGRLNEKLSKVLRRTPRPGDVSLDTKCYGKDKFVATITVACLDKGGPIKVGSEICDTKKAAEQSAAAKALKVFEQKVLSLGIEGITDNPHALFPTESKKWQK